MSKTLFMETTEVAPEKSASEITSCLIQGGARQIACDYDGSGKITGLRWVIRRGTVDLVFIMPARVDPVYNVLRKRASGFIDRDREARMRSQAERVAWRQLFRWTQAQLAMIQFGMAEPAEVFCAYIDAGAGQTLFQRMAASQFKALAPPAEAV
jgi:hypothetical protein